MQDILTHVDEHQEKFLKDLQAFLRFPSVSALPAHAADMQRCAEWLAAHLLKIGFPDVRVCPTPGHHIIYASWVVNPNKPTVLSYGHYDVQPPDPLNEWTTPPFEPAVRNNRIYARGACDDKGPLFTHIKAIDAFARTRGAPPVNIKLVIEGGEESDNGYVEEFVASSKDLLKADVVVVSDTTMESLEVPCLTYGLRGLVCYEVTIRTASRDLHSGEYGGAAPNPFKFLSRLIADAQDTDGTIRIPGFLDAVQPIRETDRELLAARPFSDEYFRASIEAPFLVGERGFSVPERIGLRPTFEVHGMPGGFTGEGFKTVIPAVASAKISMRLVPNQEPQEICRIFEQWVRSKLPEGLTVELKNLGTGRWWIADTFSPLYETARQALCKGFGVKKTGAVFEGGSIPVVPLFAETLGCPVVLLGLDLPDDNLHAPNESFGLDRYFSGIRTMAHFYAGMAAR